jgi:NodT family efflux transporter outer membrane factor (OMF) lipoprotein
VVGPDFQPPEPEMPDRWHQELARGLQQGDASLESWWHGLGDPQLDSLIERARGGNLDLRQSVARIREARAVRGVAGSERFVDVEGLGSAQRTRTSEAIVGPLSGTDNFWEAGVDAFWEIDLWGRITRRIESADAGLEASVEDYRDTLVSLYAEVAFTYVGVRAFQARIRYALANVATQRGSLQLTVDRRDAGIGSDLDVSQAERNLARTESQVPALRIFLAESVHALGVLLGEHPASLWAELRDDKAIPGPPTDIVVGLPLELLRQRPDVRRAERELASQTAEIGAATAALYPTFSLVGNFSYQALDANRLFESRTGAFGFGPAFQWNLFSGGRVRQTIRIEDAQSEQALAAYESTVLRALEETENSMVAFIQESERRDALKRSADAAERAVELVTTLYRTGLTDFQNVLDSERSLAEQQDQLAESEGQVTQNLVRIYRALGGGWTPTSQ